MAHAKNAVWRQPQLHEPRQASRRIQEKNGGKACEKQGAVCALTVLTGFLSLAARP
ncbi:hypothetical protein [Ottowia cancrivicina]|uniref:hypothetical protein n=1 Tax=Ottowia cancrivicina TaxID=3040346 RepID=UPI002441F653|nr:hypothetical protein [Ottowia sp. 10c7w1]